MSNQVPENTRQNYRRKNFRRRNKNFHRPPVEYKSCPICGKAVKSMLTAISVNKDMDPAHFDCVVKQLAEQEQLKKGEKISYLGNGTFAVIKMNQGGKGSPAFTIIKKIQYEEKDKKAEWRKKISKRLKR